MNFNFTVLDNSTLVFEKICYSLNECNELCSYASASEFFILILLIFTFSYHVFKILDYFTVKYLKTEINFLYAEGVNLFSFFILIYFTQSYFYVGLFFIGTLTYKLLNYKKYIKFFKEHKNFL